MSALGHKRTSAHVRPMSALPRKRTFVTATRMSDIERDHVRNWGRMCTRLSYLSVARKLPARAK